MDVSKVGSDGKHTICDCEITRNLFVKSLSHELINVNCSKLNKLSTVLDLKFWIKDKLGIPAYFQKLCVVNQKKIKKKIFFFSLVLKKQHKNKNAKTKYKTHTKVENS